MKPILLLFAITLSFFSCNPPAPQETAVDAPVPALAEPPPPGTVLLADSIKIPDPLNELYFTVKLVTNEYTRQGTYDVSILYGHNNATTQITFPHGGTERIIPKMKKGDEPFSYIIGFNYGEEDPAFYEYYRVKGASGKIETTYLKAYSFK